ncbi:MAG: FCD domain-containing protein [Proteobacteria bacterium]|nr:FCD domain-containing protein [Pseudomonadota bacterium]
MGANDLNQRAATRVAQNIVSDIRDRALRPGAKLEPEHIMVEKQGVARATVREALRLLEFQGALRIKAGPGGGPIVNVPGVDHLTSALSLQLQFANATFHAVLSARMAIYPVLVGEAAENASHQDIAALRASLSRVRDAVENSDAATQEARNFYELVASASKNLVLGFLVNALHRMSENSHVEYDAERWRASVEQSEKVLAAIERRDAESARAISTKALDAAIRYLEKNEPELLKQPVSWIAS